MDSIPVSDCRSALYAVRRTFRRQNTASWSCLVTAAPLLCYASDHLGGLSDWDSTEWTWTRAHTDASEVIPGTLTALQDWFDRMAPQGPLLPSQMSESYSMMCGLPFFAQRTALCLALGRGSRPLYQMCWPIGLEAFGHHRQCYVGQLSVRMAVYSWRGVDDSMIFKLPDKVYRYSDFVPMVPSVRVQLPNGVDLTQVSLADPFQHVASIVAVEGGIQ